MTAASKGLKTEYQARLIKLRAIFKKAILAEEEKEDLKQVAEKMEDVAMEKYKPAEPGKTAQPATTEPEQLFQLLDSGADGILSTIDELTTRVTFDVDRNGEDTKEALFLSNNKREVANERCFSRHY